ncbi:hypothetical protein O181_036959 [Austropuccinia psidii MF-1]|uniref:Uncharacterized protein n=1 Tax=Austropuccinia psidii MF-1 TaxID=1389203 RepID=A0A9Q3HC20_9BASI|nr:hypothetical protein [Austropuccinia psidii MF-1]
MSDWNLHTRKGKYIVIQGRCGMELCESSEIGKWSIHKPELSKIKKSEDKEIQSSTRGKTMLLGPKKNPYNSLNPICQIKNLEVTFGNEERTYLDFLVFENLNQIIAEENSSIFSSCKESIPPITDRKAKGKETEEKLEVEDCEAIAKIKEELKNMRRKLDMAIEDREKWLAL